MPMPLIVLRRAPVRLISAVLIGVATALTTLLAVYFFVIRPRLRNWGVDPVEADLALPGDGLVPEPSATETRGITIDAPPEAIWPWLVQMGYERAGWYSYDAIDNRGTSSDRILPEFQQLAVGQIMPTHPGGGFRVEVVDPERSLVLFIDTALVQQQQREAEAAGKTDLPTAGLKATDTLGRTAFPDFAASWAFFLRPSGDGKTRLVERFRARTPGQGPATAVLGEIMGTGIVLMTRKQMLGIKQRVERGPLPELAESEMAPAEPAEAVEEAPLEIPVG
jgi:hypothetical protein